MAALEVIGFPIWVQLAHPWVQCHTTPNTSARRASSAVALFSESVCPPTLPIDGIEDVCLGAPINLRTRGHFAAERTFSHGKSTSV